MDHEGHKEEELIQRKKKQYPLSASLAQYLQHFGRHSEVPLVYNDLTRFTAAVPYENPEGEETLWLSVAYPPEVMKSLVPKLTGIYTTLKIGRNLAMAEHLTVDRIDFGEFGNSRPFRIRITNLFNGNSDYYYVKQADLSRIYGLELEHILSPNRINYLVNGNTLIEDHIAGVPGDAFIRDYLPRPELNRVRIAKEFVKFGERCFIRLLGDMRSVNYVLDITPDFEEVQYRVRPIDFDQQSHEGNLNAYRAHHFPDNKPVDELVRSHLNKQNIVQYRSEERTQMARRARAERPRLKALFAMMCKDTIAPESHFLRLRAALAERFHSSVYDHCKSMGDLTLTHFQFMMTEAVPEG